MVQFNVNAMGFNRYAGFSVRIKWAEVYVAGFNKVSILKRTPVVFDQRKEADPSIVRKSSGQKKYSPIALEYGITYALKFEKWANSVWHYGSDLGVQASMKDSRKDLIIGIYNEAGQLTIAYKVYRCWVSEFQKLPELDPSEIAVAIESMKLENEGWEIDALGTASTELGLT